MSGTEKYAFKGGSVRSTLMHCSLHSNIDGRRLPRSDYMWYKRRRVIEEEIRQHHLAIRDLKRRANEELPISHLPPEILLKIFRDCISDKLYYSGNLSLYCPDTRQYLRVSQVCQRWRAVALECPTLWSTFIPFDGPEWISWLLAHTKQVPLDIWMPVRDVHDYEDMELQSVWEALFMEASHRITRLHVRGVPLIRNVRPLLRLQNLDIRVKNFDPEIQTALSRILDGSDAPELRSLSLNKGSLSSWMRRCYHPNLKQFSICVSETRDAMLDVLDGMPALEHLSLREELLGITSLGDNSINIAPLGRHPNDRLINMAHLRDISIYDVEISSAINLLSHLCYPSAELIHLTGPLSNPFSSLSTAKLRTWSKLRYGIIATDIDCRIWRLGLVTQIDVESPEQKILFEAWHSRTGILFDVPAIFKILPFSDVETLVLKYVSESAWLSAVDIFLQMPQLQMLRLYTDRNGLISFLRGLYLSDPPRCAGASGGNTCSSHHLQLLEICEVKFTEADAQDHFTCIRDCLLEKRSKSEDVHRWKIDKIAYRQCTNLDENIDALLKEITGADHDDFGGEGGNGGSDDADDVDHGDIGWSRLEALIRSMPKNVF